MKRFAIDVAYWSAGIIIVSFLAAAGLVEDKAVALASLALWCALRVDSKATP